MAAHVLLESIIVCSRVQYCAKSAFLPLLLLLLLASSLPLFLLKTMTKMLFTDSNAKSGGGQVELNRHTKETRDSRFSRRRR